MTFLLNETLCSNAFDFEASKNLLLTFSLNEDMKDTNMVLKFWSIKKNCKAYNPLSFYLFLAFVKFLYLKSKYIDIRKINAFLMVENGKKGLDPFI